MLSVTYQYIIIIKSAAQLLCNTLAFVRRHRFGDLLHRMHLIDKKLLLDVGIRINHWRQYSCVAGGCMFAVFAMFVLFVGSVIIQSIVCNLPLVHVAPQTLIFDYILLVHAITIGAYILATLAIRTRIDALNTFIAEQDATTCRVDAKFAKALPRLGRIYEQLNALSDRINESFAAIVLLDTASAFLNNILSAFAMYTVVGRVDDPMKWWTLLVNNLWNGYTQAVIILMALSGDRLASSGRRTGRLIHQLQNAEPNALEPTPCSAAVQWQLSQFSQQILHQHPSANCGLFAIDWTLIYAVRDYSYFMFK